VQLSDRPQGKIGLKVISWNLLRLTGAAVEDVAALVQRERPDLLLLQESTEEIEKLPNLIGGYFHWEPLPGRIHGLAAWSPHPLPPPRALLLPVSRMPGRLPPRVAQIVRLGDITVANVHLSHGQLLNRWQLLRVIRAVEGPAAVIGDYNAIGPTLLPGFKDVGPREPTHVARNVLRFRLDRCLVRGLDCADARALERGPSDHRPIALELATA
jgi:endonuclease/exonuclease/phosphatase (EEP) superfamily protein YafD